MSQVFLAETVETGESEVEMTHHVHHIFAIWHRCNFSRTETLDFRVFKYTCTQITQKQIIEYEIKSKFPEEYSTIDKVG